MPKLFTRAFALWLPLVVATSGLFVFAYWGIQQNYRLSANDPQIGMAEDAAIRLAQGEPPVNIVQRGEALIPIATSVAPWVAVYDASGAPLASSASLDGAPPRLPAGVFDQSSWKKSYAALGIGTTDFPYDETRFSWQPRPDVRQAVVLVRADDGSFVASGRSMREVEERISILTKGAALLWGATELATFAAIVVVLALGWL